VPRLAECPRIAFLFDDLEDLGVLLHALHEGMKVDRTEALGEGDLLLRRDFLIAEEHDEVPWSQAA
jgi:hypothetical protein